MDGKGEKIVIALGGNALQRKGEASASDQKKVVAETAKHLASLVRNNYKLVIVHGNGPQVGNIVLHEEAINTTEVPTMPLDSCVAMSQGSIGYWLQQALTNEFTRHSMKSIATTMATQTVVDKNDSAFNNPSKPIGPFYETEPEARQEAERCNFVVKEDSGRGWRRVVPSPLPSRIVEEYTLRSMIDAGVTIITAGGGGIPVIQNDDGTYEGVEAVIDKDFSASVVADAIDADKLVILTTVDHVMTGFGTPNQKELHDVSVDEMNEYIKAGEFAPGSMLPKVEASLKFLSKPGRTAIIASLDKALDAVNAKSGTIIRS